MSLSIQSQYHSRNRPSRMQSFLFLSQNESMERSLSLMDQGSSAGMTVPSGNSQP